jgi:hypothetical protein
VGRLAVILTVDPDFDRAGEDGIPLTGRMK